MARTLRPFLLPIGLIVLLLAVLLAMDPRASGTRNGQPKVALVQHASIAALDSAVDGIVQGLAARGFAHGTTLQLTRFNAQGDMGTASDIDRQVTGGGFGLIVTASTLSLQSLANADQVIRITAQVVARDRLTTLMVTHSMAQAVSLGDRLIMMHRGRVIADLSGAQKSRLRPDDLLARFKEVRSADLLDERAAHLLAEPFV